MAFSSLNIQRATGDFPNPVFWLDAGDAASVSGVSATSWDNIIPAPSDGSAQADYNADRITSPQPTYSNAGVQSSWQNASGTGYFDITPNTTFLNSLHKDSAVFTAAFVYQVSGSFGGSDTQYLVGNTGTSGSPTGLRISVNTVRNLRLKVLNAGATVLDVSSSLLLATAGIVTLFAVSVNESTGTGLFYARNSIDGRSTESFTATYASPASGNATYSTNIMAAGNGEEIIPAHASSPHLMLQGLLFNQYLDGLTLDRLYASVRIAGRY